MSGITQPRPDVCGHRVDPSPSTLMDHALPQLWELGTDVEELVLEADELAIAELADVGLADRVRGWRGHRVQVDLPDDCATGTVESTFRDAFVLAETDSERLVALAAVCGVTGPAVPAQPPVGRERGSGLSVCRRWVGRQVALSAGGRMVVGRLSGVGDDHLQFAAVGGVRLVPWHAVTWVRA